jgi:hypothetical protein
LVDVDIAVAFLNVTSVTPEAILTTAWPSDALELTALLSGAMVMFSTK